MTLSRLRLRRLVDVDGGSWGTEPEDGEVVARCIRGTDFDFIRLRTEPGGAPERGFRLDEFTRRAARRGDLIIEKSGGGDQQPVGRAVLHDADEPVVPTNFAARLRPRPTVDSRFLCYLLASLYSGGHTAALVKQTTGIQNLDLDALLAVAIRLPSEKRQRGVADFLDTETTRIDALITKKRRIIELLRDRNLTLIYRAVTGSDVDGPRRDSGVGWIGDVPSNWGTPWLGAHYETQLGKMLNAEGSVGPEQYQYVRNTNVQWDRFDLDHLATMHFSAKDRLRCELRTGDLLVCEGGEVGRAAVWRGEPQNVYFQKAIHRVRPLREGNTRFLMYCLRAASYLDVFRVEGNQSTIVHLTGEKLREHRFPVPPLDEQDRIVNELDRHRDHTRALTERLTRQVELLQEHRQAIITAAVTGELEVPGVAA